MGCCATCGHVFVERLPYCSQGCAAHDLDYLADLESRTAKEFVWYSVSEASNLRLMREQWNARTADPTDPHPRDWARELEENPSMNYGVKETQ